jgi:hypothetical protein
MTHSSIDLSNISNVNTFVNVNSSVWVQSSVSATVNDTMLIVPLTIFPRSNSEHEDIFI